MASWCIVLFTTATVRLFLQVDRGRSRFDHPDLAAARGLTITPLMTWLRLLPLFLALLVSVRHFRIGMLTLKQRHQQQGGQQAQSDLSSNAAIVGLVVLVPVLVIGLRGFNLAIGVGVGTGMFYKGFGGWFGVGG
ncbi:hypothetical protein GALMADRAFT_137534 [Galerina marginata CBS 339.88]|uniref:Uncharacterized protein n=1 Tax=Galerina marginata (strain CBS 339.88) TaxID=685588 RepID=A0A067T5T9_GALM3|nr:hypothetical protein GALMADRAFT_137534 [Galerina marginata CBS 339.88]